MSTTVAPQHAPAAVPAPPLVEPSPGRLLSLDVFRGITIAGMLLVNNPGSWDAVYEPLDHAKWNGWTPTDLIFPFFLFIVGVSMTFSFTVQERKGTSRARMLGKVAKRSAVLFLLGLVLAGFPRYDLSTIRIPGVLQRIAVAFLLASVAVLFLRTRGQAVVALALLLGYWAAMKLVPVPGYGAGNLAPEANLGAYVDRAVIGSAHLWKSSVTWDPEGILSTFPAVATVLLGVFTGRWLRSGRAPAEKAVWMFVAGNAGMLVGVVWNELFPINKNLWTSSYVVFTAGMALHFLATCYWLVDVKGYRRWASPFVWFGMNAIAAFFLSGLVGRILNLIQWAGPDGKPVALKTWLFRTLFASWLPPYNASLAFAVAFVLAFTGIVWAMHRRGLFIKV